MVWTLPSKPRASRSADAGSQFASIRYGERLAELGATPSIGLATLGLVTWVNTDQLHGTLR